MRGGSYNAIHNLCIKLALALSILCHRPLTSWALSIRFLATPACACSAVEWPRADAISVISGLVRHHPRASDNFPRPTNAPSFRYQQTCLSLYFVCHGLERLAYVPSAGFRQRYHAHNPSHNPYLTQKHARRQHVHAPLHRQTSTSIERRRY